MIAHLGAPTGLVSPLIDAATAAPCCPHRCSIASLLTNASTHIPGILIRWQHEMTMAAKYWLRFFPMQLVFALSAATATFFLVPRGVSAGEIDIHSDRMSWNTSKGTYQLNLLAHIPIYNPNYLNVRP